MGRNEKGEWQTVPHHELLKTHPHLKDFLPFLDVLNRESPRGTVLVASSHLEILLQEILTAFLIRGKSAEKLLSGFNAPLGSLSAKIAAVDSLGLLEESEVRESDIIRKIRNRFAHEVHIDFDDPAVRSLCGTLSMAAEPYGDIQVNSAGQFTTAAVCLISRLTNRAHYVGRSRLSRPGWPI